jgi:hypothetical protein
LASWAGKDEGQTEKRAVIASCRIQRRYYAIGLMGRRREFS